MDIFPSDYSIADGVTAATAVIGGCAAVGRYLWTNRQAAARAAADEIERFNSDEQVKLAFQLIDWYSGSFPYVDGLGERKMARYRPIDFHLALRPHTLQRRGQNKSSPKSYAKGERNENLRGVP